MLSLTTMMVLQGKDPVSVGGGGLSKLPVHSDSGLIICSSLRLSDPNLKAPLTVTPGSPVIFILQFLQWLSLKSWGIQVFIFGPLVLTLHSPGLYLSPLC